MEGAWGGGAAGAGDMGGFVGDVGLGAAGGGAAEPLEAAGDAGGFHTFTGVAFGARVSLGLASSSSSDSELESLLCPRARASNSFDLMFMSVPALPVKPRYPAMVNERRRGWNEP